MRVLVLGSSGFLGKYIYFELKKKFLVFSTGLKNRNINLTNFKHLEKLVLKSNPSIIINCSGLTDIEKCQKKVNYSNKINVELLKNIFKIKNDKNINFKLIHFSSDQVYNPKKNKLSTENNNYNPINVYSMHKLKSEKICIKNNSLIFRLNILGKSKSNKKSFSDWIFKNLVRKNEINGFIDSFYSPLNVTTISEIILKILSSNKYKFKGIYNLGSKFGISKYELIKSFGKKLKIFDEKLVKKQKINDICNTPRTKYNRLNVKKFEKKFNIKLPNTKTEIIKLTKFYEKN